ncbi:MAG: hypothetical protein F6K09_04530 [Merismopedia sp. SIO2A8]|nr:hypothetical protein [Merismopedia sp. SIO2A8]
MTQHPLAQRLNRYGCQAISVILASVAAGLLSALPTAAQTASEVDPLEDFQTQDSGSDIFSGDGQQTIQDLIHNLRFSTDLSMEEFLNQREDNILSEADRFRQLQRDRMNQGQEELDSSIDVEFDLDPASDVEE